MSFVKVCVLNRKFKKHYKILEIFDFKAVCVISRIVIRIIRDVHYIYRSRSTNDVNWQQQQQQMMIAILLERCVL